MRSRERHIVLSLGVAMAVLQASPRALGQGLTVAAAAAPVFAIQPIEAPMQFSGMGDRSLRLDRAGRPHVVFGGSALYHASHDGSAWRLEKVDEIGGGDASLALDAADNPWISYLGAEGVHVAHRIGERWLSEVVEKSSDWLASTSIALDRDGVPHVAYYDMDTALLRHATVVAGAWVTEEVAGVNNWLWNTHLDYSRTSIAIDAAGRPAIAFENLGWEDLRYATWDGVAWHEQTVDSAGSTGVGCSLAFDPLGRPAISYYDLSNDVPRYAAWNGSAWSLETIDATDYGWGSTALAFDGDGRPAVAYPVAGHEAFRLARSDGAAWQVQVVEDGNGEDVGDYCSLAFSRDGTIHASYISWVGALHYARLDGTAWGVETLARTGKVGSNSSLALDAAGRPHVAYRDDWNGHLKYARWDGAAWHLETVDATGVTVKFSSVAVDAAGNPHIAYYDVTNEDLRYARWTGTTWELRTVDSVGDVGWYPSIAVDRSGKPHIAYYHWDDGDLKWARWTGTTWSIRNVESNGDVGEWPSLALDADDRPHIAYFNRDSRMVRYARWGGSTFTRENVDAAYMPGVYASLRLDAAGNPAIAYVGFVVGSEPTIRLARKAAGKWNLQTAFTAEYLSFPSLALDSHGDPHIAFYLGGWDTNLLYTRWAGSAWATQGVDTLGSRGQYASLAIDGADRAFISYYDYGGSLLLATQVDADTKALRRHLPRQP